MVALALAAGTRMQARSCEKRQDLRRCPQACQTRRIDDAIGHNVGYDQAVKAVS